VGVVPRLEEIVGQARAVEVLRRAIDAGKLPHAYLFAGPAGVGKATTARALAAALNCESGAAGCSTCVPCGKIEQGIHPDVLTLKPQDAGNMIKIEPIRDLRALLAFPPHEARARVVILEDADRMNPQAQNAFLKTLEEPPPRTHFVLVTTAPDVLLVTIRSRSQKVRFGALGVDAIAGIVARGGVPAERAAVAASLSGGSVARAAELAAGEEALEEGQERLRRAIAAAESDSFQAAVEAAQAMAGVKEDLLPTLHLLACFYRDAAALAAGVPPDGLMNRDRPELRTVAARADAPALARRAARVLEAQTAIIGFAHPQLTLEAMILGLRGG
jgi:DNA polymerase-3 subunit delta'